MSQENRNKDLDNEIKLAEKQAKTRMEQMIAHATEVVLADDEGFQERFMNAMNFA